MKFEIDAKLVNKIFNYLVSKPYNEVAVIIAELSKLVLIEDSIKKPLDDKGD